MASEEEVLCVDSSYETIDVIDLTKESPKMRPLRSRLRQHNLSTVYNNRSSSLKAHQRLSCLNSPLTLGTQDSAICCDNTKNSLRIKKRIRNVSMDSTVNLDDTNEDNEIHVNLTANNNDDDDDEKPSCLNCPICLESLSSKSKPTTTRCGHIFCSVCLEKFIHVSKKKKCPTCQSNITLKSCTRLYI